MYAFLRDFLQKNHLLAGAPIPLSDCRLLRPHLLERTGIREGTVFLLAAPYLAKGSLAPDRNFSAYAIPRDYHLFFSALFERLIPLLEARFPDCLFRGFADHSPIDEVEAAAKAGLGVIGENSLLITPTHSSYVFLGEIITDARLPAAPRELEHCMGCGACTLACPAKGGTCLSALTQKKGALSPEETEALLSHSLIWGCDRCQEVCPHTRLALEAGTIYTEIPFFRQDLSPSLSLDGLHRMTDTEFASRAYAWRGKDTLLRNLTLKERRTPPC